MALKLARVITGKTKVVSWHDSFHGASLDAISAGGEEQFKKYMGDFPNTINISQPVADALTDEQLSLDLANEFEAILKRDQDVGAFIAETIRNTDVIGGSAQGIHCKGCVPSKLKCEILSNRLESSWMPQMKYSSRCINLLRHQIISHG